MISDKYKKETTVFQFKSIPYRFELTRQVVI